MSDPQSADLPHPPSLEALEARLIRALGAVVGGGALSRTLGYRTQAAFRQAVARNRLPVPTFVYEGRRGRFAHTADIARWLWSQRNTLAPNHPIPKEVDPT